MLRMRSTIRRPASLKFCARQAQNQVTPTIMTSQASSVVCHSEVTVSGISTPHSVPNRLRQSSIPPKNFAGSSATPGARANSSKANVGKARSFTRGGATMIAPPMSSSASPRAHGARAAPKTTMRDTTRP